jgi:hypothetical protein
MGSLPARCRPFFALLRHCVLPRRCVIHTPPGAPRGALTGAPARVALWAPPITPDDDALQKLAMRIQSCAVRRCGELLKTFDAQGKRSDKLGNGADTKFSQRDAAEQAGISKRQQVTAVRVAKVPQKSSASYRRPPRRMRKWCGHGAANGGPSGFATSARRAPRGSRHPGASAATSQWRLPLRWRTAGLAKDWIGRVPSWRD